MKSRLLFLSGVVIMLFAKGAFAHTFGTGGAGFSEGFSHPFSGLDHLLAMLAVGVWATQIHSRFWWLMPVMFMGAMATGALAGVMGMTLPIAEWGIAGSVLVLGLLITFASSLSLWLAVTIVSFFAMCHGHVHGLEMPQAASPLLYGLGFVLATLLLHAAGIISGLIGKAGMPARVVRVGGAAIAASGVWLLAGL